VPLRTWHRGDGPAADIRRAVVDPG
jgi:hypothetical protein